MRQTHQQALENWHVRGEGLFSTESAKSKHVTTECQSAQVSRPLPMPLRSIGYQQEHLAVMAERTKR
jgi:hypothetical protein